MSDSGPPRRPVRWLDVEPPRHLTVATLRALGFTVPASLPPDAVVPAEVYVDLLRATGR